MFYSFPKKASKTLRPYNGVLRQHTHCENKEWTCTIPFSSCRRSQFVSELQISSMVILDRFSNRSSEFSNRTFVLYSTVVNEVIRPRTVQQAENSNKPNIRYILKSTVTRWYTHSQLKCTNRHFTCLCWNSLPVRPLQPVLISLDNKYRWV